MEIPQLPDDIIKMISDINRQERDKELAEFWEKWGEDYEDDLEEFYDDGDISSWDWNELTIDEKINIYKRHQRLMDFNQSVLCDGSAPDWWDFSPPQTQEFPYDNRNKILILI